jgi:hypothetical protein
MKYLLIMSLKSLHHKLIPVLFLLSVLFQFETFSQSSGKFSGMNENNGLLPGNSYIKYIYEFPYETHHIFYSERFPDLEIRKFLNSDLIQPVFNKIFREGFQVSDPNYRGSVEDLIRSGAPAPIDTNLIMLYMHAGWDTAFSINNSNQITAIPVYTPPDYSEISGLFFFEKWYLNPDKGFLNKEVIAYLPIRDYWDEYELEEDQLVKLKRLLFMVYQGSEDAKTKKSRIKSGYSGYQHIYHGITSTLNLYNRPYYEYIHRDELTHGVSDEEYSEWEYHTFDFYKNFYAEEFLKIIIGLTLDGRFKAEDPDSPGKFLTREEILEKISWDDGHDFRYDNLNSVIFNEDWYFNPASLRIIKKVNSITIMKHEYQYDDYTGDFLKILKIPLFTVSLK